LNDLPRNPSEDEIQAFVDGRLDPGRRLEVESWLAANPDERARVEALCEIGEAVDAAYGPLLERPIPARLHVVGTPLRAPSPAWRMAAAIALLVAGAAGGWFANESLGPRTDAEVLLARGAVHAHRTYEAEVRHAVEVPAREEAHLMAWLSKRLDAPLLAPNLDSEGYRLVGGRLLPASDSGPAAQFMYEAESGARLTLYVEQNPGQTETAFRFTEYDGVSAFWWKDGPLAYVLIGRSERDELLTLARATYGQLNP
jgi:anti-sigma factor RsiW